jgi:hypothetical protein
MVTAKSAKDGGDPVTTKTATAQYPQISQIALIWERRKGG